MSIKFLYFDLGDTLIYKPEVIPTIHSVLEDAGYSICSKTLAKRHFLLKELTVFPVTTSREFYEGFNAQLLNILGVMPDANLITKLIDACSYLPWEVLPEIEMMNRIQARKGILSNWDSTLKSKIEELLPYDFPEIIYSDEFGESKPHPSIFQHAIERAGLKPEEICFLGDSVKLDIVPATKCGIKAVLLDRLDLYPSSEFPRIQSLGELPDLVAKL